MKIIKKLSPIQESISSVGKNKKLLKEENEKNYSVYGTLPTADAVATEQHIRDRAEGLERRANPDKDPLVKDLIDETASANSRTLHYDVVDRKDLAKLLTEAKKKKCTFKVGKSNKLGYRYFVDIFPVYGSKGALDVDDGSTDVDGEDLMEELKKGEACRTKIKGVPGFVVNDGGHKKFLKNYDEKRVEKMGFKIKKSLKEGIEDEIKDYLAWCKKNGKSANDAKNLNEYIALLNQKPLKEGLGEDLELYTTSLQDFKPAKEAEDLWNEIVDSGKLETLEGALENVFKTDEEDNTSIDIEALNDLLINHPDFIRTLISLDETSLGNPEYDEEPVGENELVVDDYPEEAIDIDEPDVEDEDDDVPPVYPEDEDDGYENDYEDYADDKDEYERRPRRKPSRRSYDDYPEEPRSSDSKEKARHLEEDTQGGLTNPRVIKFKQEIDKYLTEERTPLETSKGSKPAHKRGWEDYSEADLNGFPLQGGEKDQDDKHLKDLQEDVQDGLTDPRVIKFKREMDKHLTEGEEPANIDADNSSDGDRRRGWEDYSETELNGFPLRDEDNDLTEDIAKGFLKRTFVESKDLSQLSAEEKRQELARQTMKQLTEDDDDEVVDVTDEELAEALGMPTDTQKQNQNAQAPGVSTKAAAPTNPIKGGAEDEKAK